MSAPTRLAELLRAVYGRNRFYTKKFDDVGLSPESLRLPDEWRNVPVTTKQELVADQQANPPWGTTLTEPLERYTRYSQTSSTTGTPLRWLDTNESWQWMLECWKDVYRAAHVTQADRVLFPFSFGPFLGFWTAFEAACQLGAHAIPAGGMTSQARLGLVETLEPTVVCCTPTYALRLAEVAAESWQKALSSSSVRALIVAGEPGGNVPATRARIETSWGARVIDHHGLTEVGPVSFECWETPGALHLNENEYHCEVLRPHSLEPVADGTPGELVITNLGRMASPVIRYRTCDIVVRRSGPCRCGRSFARLEGGILSRVDDMIAIRGVNVFPSALEDVARRFDGVAEYRVVVGAEGGLRTLSMEVETFPGLADDALLTQRLSAALHESLGLRVSVSLVPAGTLPRFEMKARRFVVHEGLR